MSAASDVCRGGIVLKKAGRTMIAEEGFVLDAGVRHEMAAMVNLVANMSRRLERLLYGGQREVDVHAVALGMVELSEILDKAADGTATDPEFSSTLGRRVYNANAAMAALQNAEAMVEDALAA